MSDTQNQLRKALQTGTRMRWGTVESAGGEDYCTHIEDGDYGVIGGPYQPPLERESVVTFHVIHADGSPVGDLHEYATADRAVAEAERLEAVVRVASGLQ